jgi:agmatine/peptidylarginine deiminase
MKNLLLFGLTLLYSSVFSQEIALPRGLSDQEKSVMAWEQFVTPTSAFAYIPTPPPYPVRHMAEWEELQALAITWRAFPGILTEIAYHAAQEVKVTIFCNTETVKGNAENSLLNAGVNMDNIEFVIAPNNSIWIRDYGPNCVYKNGVEELNFVDWVYNRPRPEDDIIPLNAADHFGVPLYTTTESPYRLVNTGGNFMSDGQGNAFSSTLILEENEPGNPYNAGPHTAAEIDGIMKDFMGIERYTKMETLPYDGIHHIDMHMRLLDEETLMVGQYPEGVADGPQIEANLQYVLDNFMSCYGTPYKVVRIVQPPDGNGLYPNFNGEYRTYTNSVLVNKTILVPTYEEKYDTTALRIYKEQFPGYKVVGIDCNDIIPLSGALHCITKEIGATDPLWITHQRHPNVEENDLFTASGYTITADLKHKSGIAGAMVYYTVDTTASYQPLQMLPTGNPDEWTVNIPHQPDNSIVYYYISGTSNSQKTGIRPLAAPDGFYKFKVSQVVLGTADMQAPALRQVFPNPADAITVVPVQVKIPTNAEIALYDVYGQKVESIFLGQLIAGDSRYYFDASALPSGLYFVTLRTALHTVSQKVVVK